MRLLAFLILICGIALSGGAVFYANKFFELKAIAIETDSKMVTLLAMRRSLGINEELRPEHLKAVEWPRAAVPKGAFAEPESIFGEGLRDRRYLVASLEPGELVLEGKLSRPNECARIGCDVPPGMRLISIPIGATNSVSGFVQPGDHVDIFLTQTIEGTPSTGVLLPDVEVRAIDQNRDDERGPKVGRTATVLVTIRDAQKLTLALQSGRLALVLRGPGEDFVLDPELPAPVTPDDLHTQPKAPKPEEKGIWVNRGGERVWVPLLP